MRAQLHFICSSLVVLPPDKTVINFSDNSGGKWQWCDGGCSLLNAHLSTRNARLEQFWCFFCSRNLSNIFLYCWCSFAFSLYMCVNNAQNKWVLWRLQLYEKLFTLVECAFAPHMYVRSSFSFLWATSKQRLCLTNISRKYWTSQTRSYFTNHWFA